MAKIEKIKIEHETITDIKIETLKRLIISLYHDKNNVTENAIKRTFDNLDELDGKEIDINFDKVNKDNTCSETIAIVRQLSKSIKKDND